jgi:hypothetical protein
MPPSFRRPKKSSELPLEAYKLLVGLIEHEEQMLWSRNQAFLVINGAMITALGVIRPSQSPSPTVTPKEFYLAFCAVSVLANLLWLLIILRSEAFYNYWAEQIKYLEGKYLAPINTFQLGDEYFSKGEVMLGNEKLKLPRGARVLRIYQTLSIVSLGFLAIWVVLAIYLSF